MDIDNIIKGLDCCIIHRDDDRVGPFCEDCPYCNPNEGTCTTLDPLLHGALSLVKRNQIQNIKNQHPSDRIIDMQLGTCPQCGAILAKDTSRHNCKKTYCDCCGQRIGWE